MSKAKGNISANYIGQIWSVISVFVFVPFYINILGTELYGLIGFYITLMSVLAFADVGLTAALTRDMARLSSNNQYEYSKGALLKTFELLYFGIAILVATGTVISAPLIASDWLITDEISTEELTYLIQIMGIAIAMQLPANLFLGGILGLQRQVLANILQIAWSMFRGIGSIAVLYFIEPTIEVFFYWQLLSNALYLFFTRFFIWRSLNEDTVIVKYRFNGKALKQSWKYAAGMFGMSLISIALLQLDKLIVSKLLSIELLGFYMLAATIATVPGILGRPITRAMFPKFTALVAENKLEELYSLYHKSSEIVALVIVPSALTGAIFATELMYIWVGSVEISEITANVTGFLILGALLQSMTAVPFHVALAFGNVSLNLKVGLISIILVVPLLIVLIPDFGIEGASLAWLGMNLLIVPPYIYFLHQRFLSKQLGKWVKLCVLKPLILTLPIILLGAYFIPSIDSKIGMFFYISTIWIIAFTCLALSINTTRNMAFKFLNLRKDYAN